MLRRSRRAILTLVALAAAIVLPGCEDINETFTNPHGQRMTELRVWVKIEGAGTTFPATTNWYNNAAPTITPLGGGHFKLTWPVNVRPGGSVHVGCSFKKSQTVKLTHHNFWGPAGFSYRSAGMSLTPRYSADMGLVVDASNEGDGGVVVVHKFDWAGSTEHVALNNLDWTDPVLALLDWEQVTPFLPFELYPGDVQTFDVPDDALDGFSHALVRWHAVDPEAPHDQLPVVEIPVADLPGKDADEVFETIH